MDFFEFEKRIVKVTKMKLPGLSVQLEMAPQERLKEAIAEARRVNNAKLAGVMALFYPAADQQTSLVLIERKSYKGVHSGQVGFPGGKIEKKDQSLLATALRETEEEVGVPKEQITVIRELSEIYIPPSNFFVYPFLGISHTTPHFIPEKREVESIIEVKLEDFLDNQCITTRTLTTSYFSEITVPAFYLNDFVVWGATAMMLNEVRELLKKVL